MDEMQSRFSRWFKDDAEAIHFARVLWDASQKWDDLVDEGDTADKSALLAWLAFGKEYHPFMMRHAHVIRPALLTMYLNWTAANVLDRGTADDVAKSFMLRAGIYTVWHTMAWCVGGHDWAVEVGPEIYRTYGETPADILKEFANA